MLERWFCSGLRDSYADPHLQGLADAAVKYGVKHLVYSSLDRGPDSDNYATNVPHMRSKFNIEKHVEEVCKGTATQYTLVIVRSHPWCHFRTDKIPRSRILRTTGFMDNWAPGAPNAAAFATMWSTQQLPTTKLQLIALEDIGKFTVYALQVSNLHLRPAFLLPFVLLIPFTHHTEPECVRCL